MWRPSRSRSTSVVEKSRSVARLGGGGHRQLDHVTLSLAPRPSVARADGEPIKPGVPRLRLADRANVAPGQHQRFLDRVLGAIRIPEDESGACRAAGRRTVSRDRRTRPARPPVPVLRGHAALWFHCLRPRERSQQSWGIARCQRFHQSFRWQGCESGSARKTEGTSTSGPVSLDRRRTSSQEVSTHGSICCTAAAASGGGPGHGLIDPAASRSARCSPASWP